MPKRDGLEVCRELRVNGYRMLCPDVDGQGDAVQERVHGLDVGADSYVVKPFALEDRLARLRALLRLRWGEPSEELSYADLTMHPATREVHRGRAPDRVDQRPSSPCSPLCCATRAWF